MLYPIYVICDRICESQPVSKKINWASEASPTLGCSIEISRDICMSVCLKETPTKNTYAKNTWAKSKVTRTRMPVKKEENFLCIS